MKTESMVIQLLQEKNAELNCVSDAFIDGISGYIEDNNLSSFCDGGDANAKMMLELYLAPITNMPTNKVILYFENYQLIKGLKVISNRIFDVAINKAEGKNIVDKTCFAEIEKKATDCISRVCSNSLLKKQFETEISDLILDIDFINGKTDFYSQRLSRKVGKA